MSISKLLMGFRENYRPSLELDEKSRAEHVYFELNRKHLTLWAAYAHGSGMTSVKVQNGGNGYLTNKRDHANYDLIVDRVIDWAKTAKPVKAKGSSALYSIPVYTPWLDAPHSSDVQRSPFRDSETSGEIFMVLDQTGELVVLNFFAKKGEAQKWLTSQSSRPDLSQGELV